MCTKWSFLFRNELLPADAVEEQRTAALVRSSGLGDNPLLIRLKTRSATVEVATKVEDRAPLGPFS